MRRNDRFFEVRNPKNLVHQKKRQAAGFPGFTTSAMSITISGVWGFRGLRDLSDLGVPQERGWPFFVEKVTAFAFVVQNSSRCVEGWGVAGLGLLQRLVELRV